ncbi:cache domain-containing protein [Limisalsivibrio acetivorans]|uniref:cache domain-containing protein n=1 Tax=Limisalsivibrio acetivorans TaxID=1304888 RepID=UPI0003F6D06C|nr:cache domain-containing protein [Limisalsivibrio acetivorans]
MSNRLKSLSSLFYLSMLITALISVIPIAYFWISSEYSRFEDEAKNLRREYIEERKARIKFEVKRVAEYIAYVRSNSEVELRERLREEVNKAHAIALSLYNTHKETHSSVEIKGIIKEALRPVRFSDGRGYIFIGSMNGTEILYPIAPEYENENIINLVDALGNFVIRKEIRLVKNRGEGFVKGHWRKPAGNGEMIYPKLTYVKGFKPFNWYIGTGEYLDDQEKDLQESVLDRISSIRYEDDGYVFAATWDGLSLSGPAKGKNMYNVTDINGKKIVQELIKAAREGGGFVDYVLPRFNSDKPRPKISYAQGIEDWEWYIGTGVNIDQIDDIIAVKRQELEESIQKQLVFIGIIFVFSLIAGATAGLFFTNRLNKELGSLMVLFRTSIEDGDTDSVNLKYNEFINIGESLHEIIEMKKSAENEAVRKEIFLTSIIENLPVGLFTKDPSDGFRIVLWNRMAEKIFGVSVSEAKGKTISEIMDSTSRTSFADYKDQEIATESDIATIQEGIVTRNIVEIKTPEGLITVRNTKVPIFDNEGKAYMLLGILEDLTQEKNMENELRSKTRELEMLNRNLEKTVEVETEKRRKNESLLFEQSKFASIGQMISAIAHQWRQPINALGLYIQDLEDSYELGELDREYIDSMTESCMHLIMYMSKTIDDFRNFYITNDSPADLDILKHIYESSSLVYAQMESKDVKLLIDSGIGAVPYRRTSKTDEESDFKVRGIPGEFKQVVINILHNSIEAITKYRKKGDIRVGEIVIAVSRDNGDIIVSFSDNGGGIPENIMSMIFDPYFTTKGEGEGTGIGLFMSRIIVEKHMNGRMKAENSERGAVITLRFPAADSE